MQAYTDYLYITTKQPREIINITHEIQCILEKSKIRDGFILVSAMHITAAVFVNDEEQGIKQDFLEWAEKLAPSGKNYHHHQTGEDNGDAHLKSILFHHEVILPVTNGKLDFGPWQQVFYGEFDGQRKKRIIIKIMGK